MADSLMSPQEVATCLLDQRNPAHNIAALEHRQRLIRTWGIPLGSNILEIGPGQGDFTVALADAVGPAGRIVAIDNAPPGYGTPPVEEAQAFILASRLGPRIEFVRGDPIEFLSSRTETTAASPKTFDFIVFCHCIWYFSKPHYLAQLLRVACPLVGTALVAEWSLSTSLPEAFPHVLSALLNNTLESLQSDSSLRNIRTAQTPPQIIRAAEGAGWALRMEQVIPSAPGQLDGRREARMVLASDYFKSDLEAVQVNEGVRQMLYAMRDAVAASVARLDRGVDAVRAMDVWLARFELS
jgi:SAM-dependent methyltransferase